MEIEEGNRNEWNKEENNLEMKGKRNEINNRPISPHVLSVNPRMD